MRFQTAAPLGGLLALASLAACATSPVSPPRAESPGQPDIPVPGTPAAQRTPALPPIPTADGPLRLEIGYPPDGATLAVRDSNFIFGSTGSGRTELLINDTPVPVAPNGGFLAFLPVPADGVYRLRATKDGESAALERTVRLPAAPAASAAAARIVAPWPAGTWAVQSGELIEVGFRAPPGGRAALLLPTGERIPLVEQGAVAEPGPGDQFRTDVPQAAPTAALVRYAGMLTAATPLVSRDTALARPRIGSLLPHAPAAPLAAPAPPGAPATAALAARMTDAVVEIIVGSDTARAPLRLNLALLPPGRPRAGVAAPPANAPHDWTVRGRNDVGGPFHYFWPPGTRFTITGERDNMYRVQLAGNRTAWVPAGDVRLLAAGAAPAAAVIGSVRFTPQPQWIDLRIPTAERLPFQVIAEEAALHIDVFGATSRVNFFQHGAVDPLIAHAEWQQVADSIFRVTVRLAEPVWGHHTFFDQTGAVVLRIRRPPRIDAAAPLTDLLIALDPGHGGEDRSTRGPTGLTEADANLFIALRLRDQLQRLGARVMMTRLTDATVPLGDRPRMAADSGAHILVSVHNNAFPDGVNPWLNAGTSMYYFHRQSADLARLLQYEMLEELGLRDIGYGRADLALVRATWMPAVLSETMFMMIPEQEAALRDPAVQERIAAAHVRALQRFLLDRARHQR
jgi:N-acetylmuramoyl-L-alanine amidase